MPIDITMPRLSDTMESGTIIKWNVQEGDAVSAGDVIADIETDKATMEMQVYDDGTVASITVPEGQTVEIGTVIAVLAEDEEEPADVTETGDAVAAAPAPAPASISVPGAAVAEAEVIPAGDGRMKVSPVARRLADEHGINLGQIQGSGPGGRIIKRDILQALETGRETAASIPPAASVAAAPTPSAPAPTATPTPAPIPVPAAAPTMPVPITDVVEAGLQTRKIALSNMRQTIARRLVESKTTIPHYQVTCTFAMDALLDLRRALNEQLGEQGVKLSVNDFIVRACAMAMHQHPQFNASWADDSIVVHGEVNIGIAISLPADRGGGLVVATIRHADQMGLRYISTESKRLAEKARTRGLGPEDMADSTFVVSNLGMFGVDNFTAIINPPNSAILAVGAAIQKPVVRDGELTVGWEMSATLSNDHRVIDGAMAAQYLATLREFLENPATLLV
ncbi:MAG: dihydrolipoamide acetyltransferase family protein [Planctomycetota bacterium]|jgi:pyruvate dehydrogenase E2 component (dihydrolipoamide acetyltransferase)